MTMRRMTLGAFVALSMTAVMIILLGSPSQAEPKKLLVSNYANGPFRDNLATPLFDDDGKFVPLDATSNTFYVKNNSKQTARATVQVVDRGTTNDFESALTFDIDIDGTSTGGTVPLPDSPGCSLVITGPSIKPGAVQAIDVSLAVADLTEQIGMDQAASLDFVVTLTQTGKNGQVEVCGEQAGAEPEVKGAQGNANGGDGNSGTDADPDDADPDDGDEAADCERDVVVSVTGDPTCVPTAVDAGASYGAGDPRSGGIIAMLAALVASTGVAMVLLSGRRRRT